MGKTLWQVTGLHKWNPPSLDPSSVNYLEYFSLGMGDCGRGQGAYLCYKRLNVFSVNGRRCSSQHLLTVCNSVCDWLPDLLIWYILYVWSEIFLFWFICQSFSWLKEIWFMKKMEWQTCAILRNNYVRCGSLCCCVCFGEDRHTE